MAARFRRNVYHTRLIFKSIFVTNLPDNTTSKDLREVCQGYGTVVDVYIPNWKRFAFVRFIRVDNVDRLVGNLCTLWIGRMHVRANVVRFERSPIHSSRPTNPIRSDNTGAPSFASALKGNPNISLPISSSPVMVLDDSCVVKLDLENYVIGEVKQFSSINNLRHVGVASWFSRLCNAQSDFVSREWIVWVDIEGVPLHAWSRSTFNNIRSRWGEEDNILEKFKITIHGKIFVLRAKELFLWSLVFNDVAEIVYCLDDDSVKGADENNAKTSKQVNLDAESDVEGVSETYFGEHDDNLGEVNFGLDTSFSYPPEFTPEKDNLNIDVQEVKGTDQAKSQSRSKGLCSRILEETIWWESKRCVSQMCDKKNGVLFIDTECVVLSSEFKLPDENHVLLRVPRENNMYNVNLNNVVPLGDLTYLFGKATLDESNL
nr:hypothetical protein [Tanacetum cinerariifolium]